MSLFTNRFRVDPAETVAFPVNDPFDPIGGAQPGIACFAQGTLAEADGGLVPVESLIPGHRIWTRGAGLRPVLRCARIRVNPSLLRARGDLQPFRIDAAAFGRGRPGRDLVVAARHRLQVRSTFQRRTEKRTELLVTVRRLQGMPGVTKLPVEEPVDYFALLLDGLHSLSIHGLLCEAFPADASAMDELFGLHIPSRTIG